MSDIKTGMELKNISKENINDIRAVAINLGKIADAFYTVGNSTMYSNLNKFRTDLLSAALKIENATEDHFKEWQFLP